MSEIDWDKAPEDATGFLPESNKYHACWVKPGHSMRVSDQKSWVNSSIETVAELVIPRPSPAWSGDGLPPVGVVCEWEHEANKGAWHKAEIKYIGSAYVIVADFAGIEQHYYLRSMKFRTIRTTEQIAADEREAAVAAMLELDPYLPNTTLGMMSRADFCRTLHDAGYRKP